MLYLTVFLVLKVSLVHSIPHDLIPTTNTLFDIPLLVENPFFYFTQFVQAVRELVVHCFTLERNHTSVANITLGYTSTQYTMCSDTFYKLTGQNHSVNHHRRYMDFQDYSLNFSFCTKVALLKCLIWIQPALQKNITIQTKLSQQILQLLTKKERDSSC